MKKFLFFALLLFCSGFLQAQETTLYIGPQLIKCNGNLDVMCMQVKEGNETTYNPFAYQIEGFTYEQGYDYELLVEKGVSGDSQNGRAGVKYTLNKVVSKKRPEVTLEIANRMTTYEDTKIFDCLLYREKGETEWHNLYGKIKGFKYKVGYEYELLVSKKLNADNGSGRTYQYALIKTLSKKASMIISSAKKDLLDKRKFILSGYSNDGSFQETELYPKVTLRFNLDENSVTGNDGCNSFGGKVTINKSAMSFGSLMHTEMACVDVTIDRIISTNLDRINRFEIEGNVLKLYEHKTLLLEYRMIMEDMLLPPKK